jgi:beta-xylosidase
MIVGAGSYVNAETVIRNGADWKDTDGNHISCHDGGITRVGDTFYWYGTSYKGNPRGVWGRRGVALQNGFNVYSSKDAVNWKYEGVCMEFPKTGWLSEGTSHRANVLYNEKTKKYVMWFFCIGTDSPVYPAMMMGVAVADKPTGPFKFVGRRKTGEEHGWGQDLGLFRDDDGKGYLVYDDGHRNIRVDLLSEDYLSSTGQSVIALKKPRHEGSAMIKYKGKYIVAGSGVCGWNSSDTSYAVASSPLGPYSKKKVMSEKRTWKSQISNFFYIKESDTVVAICDQWWADTKRTDLERSRYYFLPVSFDPKTEAAKMIFKEEWNPFNRIK